MLLRCNYLQKGIESNCSTRAKTKQHLDPVAGELEEGKNVFHSKYSKNPPFWLRREAVKVEWLGTCGNSAKR